MTPEEYEDLYIYLFELDTDDLIHYDPIGMTLDEVSVLLDVMEDRRDETDDMISALQNELEDFTDKLKKKFHVTLPAEIVKKLSTWGGDLTSWKNMVC